MNDPVLDAIRRRRVTRSMTDEPVAREQIETILEAARWAPTAGNRHLQRFVATTDPATLRVLRMVSPGMIPRPAAAAVVVCVDRELVARYGFPTTAPGPWIDVGTATATILLAAQAVGLGAGPVSSFSRAAVAVVLDLPGSWSPELIICLGHPAADQPRPMQRPRALGWRDLTRWVPDDDPGPAADAR
ncbi:nitroreductase family protein [Actinomycetospora endophytica]|uniref:Nitroreductase family protein n=1 Tax=Actinomycetospora endophytica TaxID=2291215 RepID=A0ABS8P186_9PSEU|nr:nitroreductase family protein [Actinomycetospora endophytica]MCD2191999.1 nitroreductase family protein [Actinomycetospora endophytica]